MTLYAGDEVHPDEVTSGWTDETWDEEFGTSDCEYCGTALDLNDLGPVCRDCRLGGCVDDMCHGLGYCMHRWGDREP